MDILPSGVLWFTVMMLYNGRSCCELNSSLATFAHISPCTSLLEACRKLSIGASCNSPQIGHMCSSGCQKIKKHLVHLKLPLTSYSDTNNITYEDANVVTYIAGYV